MTTTIEGKKEKTIANGVKSDGRDPKSKRFVVGNPGGPGRPIGSRDLWPEFYEAMRQVEKEKGISFFKLAWERAAAGDEMLGKMLKKLVPDLTNEVGNRGSVTINIITAPSDASVPAANRVQVFQPIPTETHAAS